MMKLYHPRKYEAKNQENVTGSQAESIPIECAGIGYAKKGVVRRKYCLANRQGAIRIDTAEINVIYKKNL